MRPVTAWLVGALLLTTTAVGAVPTTMTVQGHLTNDTAYMNGDHPVTFRIYDAEVGGSLVWAELDTLHVVNAVFTALIGRNVPLVAALFDAPSWLEVTIGASTLSPRLPFTVNAYAFWASRADTATYAVNTSSAGNGLWSTNGPNVWREAGSVGIGTSSPDQMLRVDGMLGLGPTAWVEPTTRGMFLYHAGAGGGNLYAYDYTTGKGDPLGLAGSKVVLGTYNSAGEFDGPKVTVLGNGNTGIGTDTPDSPLDVRGSSQVADDGAPPDTRSYASFGVTRSATATNKSYLALTKVGTIPWGFGINSGSDLIIGVAEPNKTIPEPIVTVTKYPAPSMTVAGNFVASGTKCRVVQGTAFGDLYFNATESAHALFSLEGEAVLANGQCEVQLDPKWLAGVTVDDRHPLSVTITAYYGRHGGQEYVERTRTGFTLIDPSGSNAAFGWKVEARQKGYEDLYLNRPMPVANR